MPDTGFHDNHDFYLAYMHVFHSHSVAWGPTPRPKVMPDAVPWFIQRIHLPWGSLSSEKGDKITTKIQHPQKMVNKNNFQYYIGISIRPLNDG